MSLHDPLILLLSLLTVLSNIALALGIFLLFLENKPKLLKDAFGLARKYSTALAILVSVFATVSSLAFSEILGLSPCSLCIVQRALMYPIPVAIILALLFRRKNPLDYSLPFAIGGGSVSLYHIFLQLKGASTPFCGAFSSNCEIIDFISFGYVTIPVMALSGFLSIAFLAVLPRLVPAEWECKSSGQGRKRKPSVL